MTIFVADLDSSEGALDSWPMVPLGELGQWGSGGTPKRGTAGYYQGEIPWLKISDLTDDDVVDSEEKITPLALKNSSAKLLQPGALLIAMYGSIGKLGLNTIACATNQAIAFCYPNERVSLKYLFWALRAFRPQLISEGKGGTQQNISQGVLKDFKIPVPPRARQDQIVHFIESTLDALGSPSNRLAAIPALLKKFRQSVLAAACSGQLTDDWRENHPDAVSPVGAVSKFASKRKSRKGKVLGADTEAELPEIPKSWQYFKLPDLGELNRGKSKHRPRNAPHLLGGPYPLIQTGDVARSQGTISAFTATYSEAGLAQSRLWPTGTVCITIAANIAETGVLTFPACFPDSVVGFIADPAITFPRFVELFMRTARANLAEYAPATSQANINMAILEEVRVPLPGLEEQAEIIRRVESLFALADSVESRLAEATGQVERTTQAILAKAFKGELTGESNVL